MGSAENEGRAGDGGRGGRSMDAESARWVRALSADGEAYEEATGRLHALLLRIAYAELNRRGSRHGITGPELDDLAHQAAADALLSITRKIGDFRGDSRFTTWAYKFVMHEVSSKLGRHFWRTAGVQLDPEAWERLPDRLGADPVRQSEARELVAALREAVDEELTERQRRVFTALAVNGVDADTLAAELGTNRNALYKTMFDARRKLRARLAANGHLPLTTARRS
ncbi:RNA polymerase sigma factor [Actinacidiphila glaucinigra]|uniref:RNA polymerase sigma-70 factor, ECF subfamily n=1 Tax=Actinacidiphila glaucinigra TaxID=235986 RepID=A0A239CIK3_9ACTN|nr:sigma-70 family RNA polymerase sigma factor [Actinacidiphila glaucinigra]SNS19294.1 RNA polymerase sigma-70 factor, ECF subfamily [Actinacidiphila glaucinigra]